MDSPLKELVHEAASAYISQERPQSLSDFQQAFDDIFGQLAAQALEHHAEPVQGLPFDQPSVAWTDVSAAIWAAATFLFEALKVRQGRQQRRALNRTEVRLSAELNDPWMAHLVRLEVEKMLEKGLPIGDPLMSLAASVDYSVREEPRRASVRMPDLDLFVALDHSQGKPVLVYDLTAYDPRLGLDRTPFGASAPLDSEPREHIRALFSDIEGLRLESPAEREIAAAKVSSRGARLCRQLLPEPLRNKLWELRGQAQTLRIRSAEPHIPWELIRLRSPGRRDPEKEPYLCEAFAVTQWLPEGAPAAKLSVGRVAVVNPSSPGLRHAASEVEELLDLLQPHVSVSQIPARLLPLLQHLGTGAYDLWHFAGDGFAHGSDPSGWGFGLEGRELLKTDELENVQLDSSQRVPLVVLNACHTGRSAFSLAGVGGWPHAFLNAGAGAFIGCHWSVPDAPARLFALCFYRNFLAGLPIGEAVRTARLTLKREFPGDPVWLAYTVFAHPEARCESPPLAQLKSPRPTKAWPRLVGRQPDLDWLDRLKQGKSWTSKREYKRIARSLSNCSDAEFVQIAGQLVRLLPPSSTPWRNTASSSKHHTYFGNQTGPFPLVIQWQWYEAHGNSLRQEHALRCREGIEAFKRSGQRAQLYLLIHNRDERSPEFRKSLDDLLGQLLVPGSVQKAESWGLQRLLFFAFNAMLRHALTALGKRQLSPLAWEGLSSRTHEVEPLHEVPLAVSQLVADQHQLRSQGTQSRRVDDPAKLVVESASSNLSLLLGEFGFGKTTAVARALKEEGDRQVLCVPGARISSEVKGTKDLVFECFSLDQLLEEYPEEDRPLYGTIARAVLEYLVKDPEVPLALILDGLDESAFLGHQGGLQSLFNALNAVRVPVVLTMRTEFWNSRLAEFESSVGERAAHGESRFRRILRLDLLPWEDTQIEEYLRREQQAEEEEPRADRLASLVEAFRSGAFETYYGDIPRRPLFLRFIVDSVADEGLPEERIGLANLMASWVRRKLLRDVLAPLRQGEGRGALVSATDSAEKELELAWEAMHWAAASMTTETETEGRLVLTGECSLGRVLKATPSLSQIQDPLPLFLKSLLLPVGSRSGDRAVQVRFAHRAFQEFFLAWHLLIQGPGATDLAVPEAVAAWMEQIQREGLLGNSGERNQPPGLPRRENR